MVDLLRCTATRMSDQGIHKEEEGAVTAWMSLIAATKRAERREIGQETDRPKTADMVAETLGARNDRIR